MNRIEKAIEEEIREIEIKLGKLKQIKQILATKSAVTYPENPNQRKKRRKYVWWTPEETKQMLEMLNRGYTRKKIARTLHMPKGRIDKRIFYLKSKGIIPNEKQIPL